jgi:hypothetical protein
MVAKRKGCAQMIRTVLGSLAVVAFLACGSLQDKATQINAGDDKARVREVMGEPGDRQFEGDAEVWQYCQTGAGFGYHDYRMIWFYRGKVTGVTSYKDHTPASGCSGHFQSVRWEDAPKHD